MRVLHFVSTLNRGSGVMRVIMNYYTHIDREKIQFDFVYFVETSNPKDSYEDEINALGGKVYRIPKPGASIQSLKALIDFFKEHAQYYTWLHNHESYLTVFLYPLAKKYGIKNVAVHAHLTKYSDKKISAIRNRILCVPLRMLPIQRVACSQAAADFLFKKNKDVFIMQNYFAPEPFMFDEGKRQAIRVELNFDDNNFVVGHIGRFEKQKNHSFLLELFKQYQKVNLDSCLLLVGSGSLEAELKKYVQENGLESTVIFAGVQKDIQAYLSAMDVFVFPSLFEGFGLVALEAQINGLPCIVSDAVAEEAILSNNVQVFSLKTMEEWLMAMQKINAMQNYDRSTSLENTLKLAETIVKLELFYSK